MVGLGEFMELYKRDATFRIKTPDGVDPQGLLDDAPWEIQKVADVGAAHPAISRVLVQGRELLQGCMTGKELDENSLLLWACKEAILACDFTARQVVKAIGVAAQNFADRELATTANRGGVVPPSVPGLVNSSDELLVQAKRAIRLMSQFVGSVAQLDGRCENFDFIIKRLTQRGTSSGLLWSVVQEQKENTKRLIDMRNAREHPKDGQTCEIKDFHVLPDRCVRAPTWQLAGHEPFDIKAELESLPEWLSEVAEHVVLGAVLEYPSPFPYVPQVRPEDQIDPDFPLRYTLGLDLSRMRGLPPGAKT